MAARSNKTRLLFLLLVALFSTASLTPTRALGGGTKVGGRTAVKDVKNNKEVQDLGRYCVQEYNTKQQYAKNGSRSLLMFTEVVEAETQVVSGIKYYLKISAATRHGGVRTYDAVVVVKAWLRSRQLVQFAPSVPPMSTK